MNLRCAIVVSCLVLSVAPAFAFSGTVPAGSNAEDLVDDIVGPWSGVLGCFKDICGDNCSFRTVGGCFGESAHIYFWIDTVDGNLTEAYNWELEATCESSVPIVTIRFQGCPGSSGTSGACGSPVELSNGRLRSFGEINVVAWSSTTASGASEPIGIPTLPRWGPLALGAALVVAAGVFIVRRTR